jgi:hypothetical protein
VTEVTVIVMSSDARDKYRGTKVYLVQYFKQRRKEDSYKFRKLKILQGLSHKFLREASHEIFRFIFSMYG